MLCVQWYKKHVVENAFFYRCGYTPTICPFATHAQVSLLIAVDAFLLPLAVWLCFWLRLAHPFHSSFISAGSWLLIAVIALGLPIYAFTGQYKGLTRYVGSAALYHLVGRNGLLVLLLAGFGLMLRLPMPPRGSWILLWLLLSAFTGAVRVALRDIFLKMGSIKNTPVACCHLWCW